jgi:hypothetical protein
LLRQQTLLKGAEDSPFLQSNSPIWSASESDRRNNPRSISLARYVAPSEAVKGEFESVFLIAFGSSGALNPCESNIVPLRLATLVAATESTGWMSSLDPDWTVIRSCFAN